MGSHRRPSPLRESFPWAILGWTLVAFALLLGGLWLGGRL